MSQEIRAAARLVLARGITESADVHGDLEHKVGDALNNELPGVVMRVELQRGRVTIMTSKPLDSKQKATIIKILSAFYKHVDYDPQDLRVNTFIVR